MLQHGLLSQADTWTMNEKHMAPAYQLADAGYDVWLGNNRGNKYSETHRSMQFNKNATAFFDYSFQELGEYDLPAQIDKVRLVTGQDKITYIGHSQGTSQMFYALTTNNKEIAAKVNLFIALAPVVTFNHVSSTLKTFGNLT